MRRRSEPLLSGKISAKARIEQTATALIHTYARQYGLEDNVPVPVDSLLE